jgi:hypothetical protein
MWPKSACSVPIKTLPAKRNYHLAPLALANCGGRGEREAAGCDTPPPGKGGRIQPCPNARLYVHVGLDRPCRLDSFLSPFPGATLRWHWVEAKAAPFGRNLPDQRPNLVTRRKYSGFRLFPFRKYCRRARFPSAKGALQPQPRPAAWESRTHTIPSPERAN